jgi:hypothetical protein
MLNFMVAPAFLTTASPIRALVSPMTTTLQDVEEAKSEEKMQE